MRSEALAHKAYAASCFAAEFDIRDGVGADEVLAALGVDECDEAGVLRSSGFEEPANFFGARVGFECELTG